jgi:uncharacterized membrane protein YbhN (UPF0104 family)
LSTLIIAASFWLVFLRGSRPAIAASEGGEGGLFEYISTHKGVVLWPAGVVFAVFLLVLTQEKGRKALVRLVDAAKGLIIRVAIKFKDAMVLYWRKPGSILTVFGLTVCMQLMVITGFWLLGVNMGIETPVKYYYVFFTLTWTLGAIPVSLGGAGVVEAFLVLLFTQIAGTGEAAAWAIALCQRAVWMLASLPGAVIHLVGAHLPAEIEKPADLT